MVRISARLSTAAPASAATTDLFNPTEEHKQLREMLRNFVETGKCTK